MGHMVCICLTLRNAELFSKGVVPLIFHQQESSTCAVSLPTVGKVRLFVCFKFYP